MPSKKAIGLLMGVFWAIGFALMACSSQESNESAPLDSQQQTTPTPDTTTLASERDDEIQEMATEPEMDECIECHTDKERLIQTADPVEEVESESSGEG